MKLICYLSNGYQSIKRSIELAKEYVKAGCDIIEIDLPARNPYLENDLIKGRMKQALNKCDDYNAYMESIQTISHNHPNTKIIIVVYEETINEIGIKKFIKFCHHNNFKDIILVGLTSDKVKKELINNQINVSCYVQYHLPDEDVESALNSNGFVYLQAKPASNNINPKYPDLKNCISYLKEQGISQPIYCGVGVSNETDVLMVNKSGADAVFIGSAILKLQDNIPLMINKIRSLKQNCIV